MGPKIFNENAKTLDLITAHEAETARLYQQIGQLTVEHDLKKTWATASIK